MGLLDRLAPRKGDPDPRPHGPSSGSANDPVFATKALPKFLQTLTSRELPVLLDLGPVVGSNVSYFGEQLGCKIFVVDIFADVDRHVREGRLEQLPELFVDGRTRKGRNGEADSDALYEEIGRLKVELDWLKKKVGMLD